MLEKFCSLTSLLDIFYSVLFLYPTGSKTFLSGTSLTWSNSKNGCVFSCVLSDPHISAHIDCVCSVNLLYMSIFLVMFVVMATVVKT